MLRLFKKLYIVLPAIFLVFGAWVLLSNVMGVYQPSLIINMPYHEAREIILQSGWAPVDANRSKMDEQYNMPHFYYDAGYTEVMACSGTGAGYCTFKFKNDSGQYLRVTTQGGDYAPNNKNPPIVIYSGLSEDFD